MLLILMNTWWAAKAWPSKMEEARVAAMYKKGDPENPSNYRPLSLLNTMFKVMASVIKNRVEAELDEMRNDPKHKHSWVVMVGGDGLAINRINHTVGLVCSIVRVARPFELQFRQCSRFGE